MKQLMIKPEKCTGCRTCELVCSFGHYEQFNPKMSNVTVMEYDAAAIAIPVMCLQCEEACCMKVCPVKAITQDEHGALVMNYDRCIGCKMCMNACPLGNISFSPRLRRVFKCDLCVVYQKYALFCPRRAITFVQPYDINQRKKLVAEQFKDVFGEEAAQ